MKIALDLAREAQSTTSPNPPVGAVVVKEGHIVGKGFTLPPGKGHAEAIALKNAGAKARGASLYTTLEPCCIYGRVPPCTRAIIDAGVNEIHVAMRDPNPLINNRGLKKLEAADIRVFLGDHQLAASQMYEPFTKYIKTGIPFVTAKFAMSLDGKTATHSGSSRWITGKASRKLVHEFRRISDAVVVGVNTIKVDDPQLTVRDSSGKTLDHQPLRVIVDSLGTTPVNARVLNQPGSTLVVTTVSNSVKAQHLKKAGAEILQVPSCNGKVELKSLLKELGNRDIVHLLIEGGGTLLWSFIEQRLVDKILAFIAPIIVGGKQAPTPVDGIGVPIIRQSFRLKKTEIECVGDDILVTGYPEGNDGTRR